MQGNFSAMKNLICLNYISFAKTIFSRSRCEFGREQKAPSRSSRISQPSEHRGQHYLKSRKCEEQKRVSWQRYRYTNEMVDARGVRTTGRKGWRVEETARHWLHRETYLPAGHLADQPPSSGFNFSHFWALPPIPSPLFPTPRFHLGLTAALDRLRKLFRSLTISPSMADLNF